MDTPIPDHRVIDPGLTRASLLRGAADGSGFKEFRARYDPAVRAWCSLRGLDDESIGAVTQAVFRKLRETMRGFSYDPGRANDPSRAFRCWLSEVVRDHVDRHRRRLGLDPPRRVRVRPLRQDPEAPPARDDRFELVRELVADRVLMYRAMRSIRARLIRGGAADRRRWQAFKLRFLDGFDVAAVVSRLNQPSRRTPGSSLPPIRPREVSDATYDVRKMIEDEFWRLNGQG